MVAPFLVGPEALETTRTVLTHVVRSPSGLMYVGPDQLLPLTSVFGAILGVLLIFWNWIIGFVRKSWRFVTRRGTQEVPSPTTMATPSVEETPTPSSGKN